MTYTGATTATNGSSVTLSSTLTSNGTPLSGQSVTLTLGTGKTAQSCTATTNSSGAASCSISSVNQVAGSVTVTVSYAGNSYYQSASTSGTVKISNCGGSGSGGSGGGGGGGGRRRRLRGRLQRASAGRRRAGLRLSSPAGLVPGHHDALTERDPRGGPVLRSAQGCATMSTVPASSRTSAAAAARAMAVASRSSSSGRRR